MEHEEDKQSRRELIEVTIKDLVSSLMYYDRKEDESLPRGAIEEAVDAGEITYEEMAKIFYEELTGA